MIYASLLLCAIATVSMRPAHAMGEEITNQSAIPFPAEGSVGPMVDTLAQLECMSGGGDQFPFVDAASFATHAREEMHNLDMQKERLKFWILSSALKDDSEVKQLLQSTNAYEIKTCLDKKLAEKQQEGVIAPAQLEMGKQFLLNMGFWASSADDVTVHTQWAAAWKVITRH